jgi:biopolymer transport protein ExbD
MSLLSASGGVGSDPLLSARAPVADAYFDVTAMVDLVFMMNIFFLLAWVNASMAEVDLPAARHCMSADMEASVLFTVVASGERQGTVYLGERSEDKVIKDDAQLEDRIRQAVEEGKGKGKTTILIKAEKQILLRQIVRISSAATAVEGMSLKLAVLEKE